VRGRDRETNSGSKLDLLNGNSVEEWWKQNFFVERNQTWKPGQKPGLENVTDAIPTPQDVKFYATASGCICHPNLGLKGYESQLSTHAFLQPVTAGLGIWVIVFACPVMASTSINQLNIPLT